MRPGLALELERDVLGDVADPRALDQTFAEAASLAERAGVLADARQHREQPVDEPRDRVRGPVLEHAEIDEQPDARVVAPVVRAAEDLGLDDPQVGSELRLVRDRLLEPAPTVGLRPRPLRSSSDSRATARPAPGHAPGRGRSLRRLSLETG